MASQGSFQKAQSTRQSGSLQLSALSSQTTSAKKEKQEKEQEKYRPEKSRPLVAQPSDTEKQLLKACPLALKIEPSSQPHCLCCSSKNYQTLALLQLSNPEQSYSN